MVTLTRNDFKWFDVGPPRNYFGNTVNFELAFSFCTDSANFGLLLTH